MGTGFFTQLGTYWFLHPAWDLLISGFFTQSLGLTGSFTQTWDLLVSGFFTQLGTYWFLLPAWDLLVSGFFTQLGTYWFLVSSPSHWDLLVPSPRLGTY